MELYTLPVAIARLLTSLSAPPRLVAHLTLVHDSACRITMRFTATWPGLVYDQYAVLLGAAIHDIGKILIPGEMTQSGHEHERAGEEMLRSLGFSADWARFARTHAQWASDGPVGMEDLMVALADKLWRGKRDSTLEATLCAHIATQIGQEHWQVFIAVDDCATALSAAADERLSWQNHHPV